MSACENYLRDAVEEKKRYSLWVLIRSLCVLITESVINTHLCFRLCSCLAAKNKINRLQMLICKTSDKSMKPITRRAAFSWLEKKTMFSFTSGARSQSARGRDVIKQHPGNNKHGPHRQPHKARWSSRNRINKDFGACCFSFWLKI